MISIDYEKALDFEHCESLDFAGKKLSQLTNLLNEALMFRQKSKIKILEECSKQKGENLHKLSWDNKLLRLSEILGSPEISNDWQDADLTGKY